MLSKKNINIYLLHFLFCLITIITMKYLYGLVFIDPTNFSFYYNNSNSEDSKMHFLGWHFYRFSAWSSPIGLNPSYGLELSSSIVYSDSIPILAIFFKIFRQLLSQNFHFFGIWIFICIYFQAYFSFKLLNLYIKEHIFMPTDICVFYIFPTFSFSVNCTF